MTDTMTTYLLAAAVVLAAALIARRFLRKPVHLDDQPEPGSHLGRFGEGIRLRDLYRLAVLLEEEGVALYLKLAELAQDPAARSLCVKLADEETEHRQLFMDRLGRWRSLNPNRITWPAFLEQVKLEGLFADPPGNAATELEIAAFAIKQERRTVEFYRMFEKGFPEAWRREQLHDLVEQEMSHERRLREAYPEAI
ncbi:MAG: ferritin family protein [Elusimicrobiales bacterium]|nr:ferritin family protein [Elusimicrobiales bacterium]